MSFKKALAFGVAAAAVVAGPAMAKPWTKTYVVEWHDLAFYYGGPASGNGDTPGSDCPNGANPAQDWKKVLKTAWRTDAEVAQILNPDFDHQQMYKEFAIRGPNKENIMDNPWVVPDKGMIMVSGKTAEGFNLDDNPKTGGFTGTDGVAGVDNAFYKVAGCIAGLRGPPRTAMWQKQQNDGMRDGIFTVIFVVSGNQDPMNDTDAKFGVYLSKDQLVKDANSEVARDYSFRIDPNPVYQTVFDATVKDGVIESKGSIPELKMRDFNNHTAPFELLLYKAKVKFAQQPNGTLTGMVGGYRDWKQFYYTQNGNGKNYSILGSIRENLWHMDMPAFYYALQREADGMPDPKTGKMTAISSAYRIDAVPAHAVFPNSAEKVRVAQKF